MRWLLVFGFWTLFGLLGASQVYYDALIRNRPVTFLKALVWQLPAFYLFALATPLILRLARRYKIERSNFTPRIAYHLLASFVFSTLISCLHISYDAYHLGGREAVTLARLWRLLPIVFDRVVFIYWTILLLSHAYDYYTQYRNGLTRTAHLEVELARAQLQALKMQLNPHFLFNTLNAISELVHRDPDTADEMITRLSDMLRSTLDKTGAQVVPLKQELDFLERYLAIERTRMGSRLQIEICVAPETLDARVPNMILQPLVENAVKHGIAPCARGGSVRIEAARHNGSLDLRVSDTGRGLPAHWSDEITHDKLCSGETCACDESASKKVLNRNGSSSVNARSGVGLANTRARLAHLYEGKGSIVLRRAKPHGVCVEISIPFSEDNSEHDTTDTRLDC